MSSYVFYNQIGSKNHGCEALVRTLALLLKGDCILLSEHPDEEKLYGIDELVKVVPALNPVSKSDPAFAKAMWDLKVKKDYFPMDALPYKKPILNQNADSIGISIGGDVYCYDNYGKYICIHQYTRKRFKKNYLIGCSVEPARLKDKKVLEDMKSYDLISARESITYHAMKEAGLQNVVFYPDSAFSLKKVDMPLKENTIGINVSPLVERKSDKVYENYDQLISYILKNTDCNIALIPHVVWNDNDDRKALRQLYDAFDHNDRMILIGDHNCMELKGYISQCRMFIGARTHATIAAYSSCVPTLVVGYSVKSRGIARDLFGAEEHYVISVDDLKDKNTLTNGLIWMMDHESIIRAQLKQVIPGYIEKAKSIRKVL